MNSFHLNNSTLRQNNRSHSPTVTTTTTTAGPQSTQLDEEFVGIMLDVESKYSTMTKHEKIRIEQWTKKLCQVTTNNMWKRNRNLYAKELQSMVNQKKLREPFTRIPPETTLPRFNKYDIEPAKKAKMASADQQENKISLKMNDQNNQSNNIFNSKEYVNNNNLSSDDQKMLNQDNSQKEFKQQLQQQPQQHSHQQQHQHYLENFKQIQAKRASPYQQNTYSPQQLNTISPSRSPNEDFSQNSASPRQQLSQPFIRVSSQQFQQPMTNQKSSSSQQVNCTSGYEDYSKQTNPYYEEVQIMRKQLEYQEQQHILEVKKLEEGIQNSFKIHQKNLQQYEKAMSELNQTLSQKSDENSVLTQQIRQLRNVVSNIAIQIYHIKDSLPQPQSVQLGEIEQHLRQINLWSNQASNKNSEQSQHHLQTDTSEKYAVSNNGSILKHNYSNGQLVQPLKSSIVNKIKMSPNISQNKDDSFSQTRPNSQISSRYLQDTQISQENRAHTPQPSNIQFSNNTSLQQQQQSQFQQQQPSQQQHQQQQSQIQQQLPLQQKVNTIQSAAINQRYLGKGNQNPFYYLQAASAQHLQKIQQSQQSQSQQQQIQQQQLPVNQNSSHQQIGGIQSQQQSQQQSQSLSQQQLSQHTPLKNIYISDSKIQKDQVQHQQQQQNTQLNNENQQIQAGKQIGKSEVDQRSQLDTSPITLKNEQDTQDFLQYLDNFQKRTEKLKSETNDYLVKVSGSNQQ